MKTLVCFSVSVVLLFSACALGQQSKATDEKNEIAGAFFAAETIAFLGDSITYNGAFIAELESTILANGKQSPTLLNLGLSSETCSGCSEPTHPWPRPNVHERFDRLLSTVKPDLLVVCYGINDGIYHPFNEGRFEKYKSGINKIIAAADKSEGQLGVILLTPPPFDAHPLRVKNALASIDSQNFDWKNVYENYDSDVMAVYSAWLHEQKDRVIGCVDLRTPFIESLAEKRKSKPNFRYAHDGVHVNRGGHKLIAAAIANSIGLDSNSSLRGELAETIGKRQTILRNSWLSEVGHKRPNIVDGLPIEKAKKAAAEMDRSIAELLKKQTQNKTK